MAPDPQSGDMSDINSRSIPNPMSIDPAFEVIAQPDGRFVNCDYSDPEQSNANPRRFGGGND